MQVGDSFSSGNQIGGLRGEGSQLLSGLEERVNRALAHEEKGHSGGGAVAEGPDRKMVAQFMSGIAGGPMSGMQINMSA